MRTNSTHSAELLRLLQPISQEEAFDSHARTGYACADSGVVLTAPRGSQGRDMKKWYRPFGLLVLATMIGELCGCAQTTGWLAKKPTKKRSDEKVVDAQKKPRDKDGRRKSSKELAESKSDESKIAKTDTKDKPKSVDSEHTKFVSAAEHLKKVKPRVDPFAEESSPDLVASDKPARPKSKPAELKTDDELDSFLSKIESPTIAPRTAVAKKTTQNDLDSLNDNRDQTKTNVVQVKKEVAKGEESSDDDNSDWAEAKAASNSKSVKPANAATASDSFDDDFETPSATTAHRKTEVQKIDAKGGSPELSIESLKKIGIKKAIGQGLHSLCPDAEGELTALLKDLDPTDVESMKQGLHHISQMGSKGAAAAPLLQKMLKHEDAFVRTHSALAMARLKLTSPESIKVVTDSLKSRDASLRSFGTAVLGEMGPQSKQVLTTLSDSLNDKDGQVRLRAAEVLIRHEHFAYPALQSLLACLKDKDDNVRWLATYSLAELAPESPEAVQALLKTSHDPVSKVSVGAVYALGEIGPFAKRSSDELGRLLDTSNDEELKSAINYALQQMDK